MILDPDCFDIIFDIIGIDLYGGSFTVIYYSPALDLADKVLHLGDGAVLMSVQEYESTYGGRA